MEVTGQYTVHEFELPVLEFEGGWDAKIILTAEI
jgi:hypothetical protein